MGNKTTLVMGATENTDRYSNRAIRSLRKYGHPVKAIGLRAGKVDDVIIEKGTPDFSDIDTVTMYLSEKNQKQYQDYIISLKPKRIIYNPGAENPELEELASKNNIENLEACTLVLLATGQY
jgi:predicted CoA-binding protein